MHEVTVSAEGLRLLLRVVAYEYPNAQTGYDANWLTGDIELTHGGASFKARRAVSFLTTDLVAFRDEVKQLLSDLDGRATLQHIEGEFGCTIRLEHGSGEIDAFLKQHYPEIELRARGVRIDQSYLQETVAQLDAFLLAFPVRGTPYE